MKLCLFVQQTNMHTMIDAFNCRFVFLGSSLDHVWISDICARCCTLCQGRHHASSPAPRTQETCSWASPHHVRQVYRLADTRFSASSEAADIVTLRSIVLLVIFWLTVLVGCCSWDTASCTYPPCSFSQECLLFHCNSLTPCRNEVLAALRRSPCLEHTRQRSCPSSTHQIYREKPLAGYMYIGIGKRETVRPAVCDTNVDTRKTTCYHDAKEKAMIDAKTVSFLNLRTKSLSRCKLADRSDEVLINRRQHAHDVSRPRPGRFHRRRSGVQPWPRIIAGDRDRSRFAMSDCTVSRLLFLILTFSLCVSQLFRSASNSICKLRCETG